MLSIWMEMLTEYYRFRGWTPEGLPTPKKLAALCLAEMAKEQSHA
jgi:aldehyde:ferredoxin oxidoreductase